MQREKGQKMKVSAGLEELQNGWNVSEVRERKIA